MDELLAFCQLLDIDSEELNKPFTIWRFDTLHVRGVDQLTSVDIFNYFGPIKPHSIEWLSNISCNVTFDSFSQACNALQAIATGLIIHKNQNPKSGNNETTNLLTPNLELEIHSSDSLEIPVPPNYRYILGSNHTKAKSIIIRFATINDKKISSTTSSSFKPEPMDISLSSTVNDNRTNFQRNNRLNRDDDVHVLRSFNSRFKIENRFNFRLRMRADEEERNLQRKRQTVSTSRRNLSSRLTTNDLELRNRFRSNGGGGSLWSPLNRSNGGHHPTSVSKSKNHIWRRSIYSPLNNNGQPFSSRNDLREKLSTKNALVRVRVSYED